MKTLKLSFDLMIKSLKYYTIHIFEIIIVSFILLSLAGKVQSVLQIRSIKNLFAEENSCFFTPYSYFDTDSSEIQSVLEKNDIKQAKIFSLHLNLDNTETFAYGYSEEIIRRLNIVPEQGAWFDIDNSYQAIPVIAIGEQYKIGDILDCKGEQTVSLQIIAVLNRNQFIMYFERSASTGHSSISYLFGKPHAEFIIPYNCENIPSLKKEHVLNAFTQNSQILILPDNIKNEVSDKIGQYGDITDFSDMKKNFIAENRNYFFVNGIVLIIFSMVTLAGIGGINSMMEIKNERRLTVCYILGMTKKKCMIIEGICFGIIISAGYILFLLLYFFIGYKFFLAENLVINKCTFVLILGYIILIYVITSVPFIIRIKSKELMSLYKQKA